MGLRPMEILLILAVLLLLFGATRLPQLGSSLGSAIRNFKKGFGGEGDPVDDRSKPGNLTSGGSTGGTETKDGSKVASRD